MNANYRLKTHTTFLLLITLLASGCGAARASFKNGTRAEISRDYETAMEQYRQALAAEPNNIEYRLKYEQTRFSAAYVHFTNGRRALEVGDAAKAKAEFLRAIEIDPSHDFAQQELASAERMLQNRSQNQPDPLLDFEKRVEATKLTPTLGLR